MVIQQRIEKKLIEAMSPVVLQLENESDQHAGPPGRESHFKLTVVSEVFCDQRKVRRHQAIYAELADELAGPVHALAIHAYTPEEWQQRGQVSPVSPECAGQK